MKHLLTINLTETQKTEVKAEKISYYCNKNTCLLNESELRGQFFKPLNHRTTRRLTLLSLRRLALLSESSSA